MSALGEAENYQFWRACRPNLPIAELDDDKSVGTVRAAAAAAGAIQESCGSDGLKNTPRNRWANKTLAAPTVDDEDYRFAL